MFRLFQSIFGSTGQGPYPESLVTEAIERAVDGTDPWLRAVSGYKRKLKPAVIRAIDHVVALVDGLSPPIDASVGSFGTDPLLKAFFISSADMRKVFGGERNLADFLRGEGGALPRVTALLMVKKVEKVILGVELSGDIIMRDVPQRTVSFEAHQLLDPTGDESETRRLLKRRAFDHLLSIALRRISLMKMEREDLERRRSLLEAKLNLLQNGNWGFDAAGPAERPDLPVLEEKLGQIESQLLELGGDSGMLKVYLDRVVEVLGRPEEILWARKESLIVDKMGITRTKASSDVPELMLDELCNAAGERRIVSLVSLPGDELRTAVS